VLLVAARIIAKDLLVTYRKSIAGFDSHHLLAGVSGFRTLTIQKLSYGDSTAGRTECARLFATTRCGLASENAAIVRALFLSRASGPAGFASKECPQGETHTHCSRT